MQSKEGGEMITFTDEAWAEVVSTLNDARQMVQLARVDSAGRHDHIEAAHRILGACGKAIGAGVVMRENVDEDTVRRIVYHEQREATELRMRVEKIRGDEAYKGDGDGDG